MLGQDLMERLAVRHEALGLDLPEADITDPARVLRFFKTANPEGVIHTAAFTAVDECERRPELAFQVNSEGTRNVALACRQGGLPMLYISTDYVFEGEKSAPYVEEDTPNPVSVYGRSKLEGEKHVQELLGCYWIVRTSWLFGLKGKNFVEAILLKAAAGEHLRVVADQIGAPTYTVDLAQIIEQIMEKGRGGIYHATNQGHCSWFDFAREIVRLAGLDRVQISPISSSELDRPARRPKNSRLLNARLQREGLSLLPSWQDALIRYMRARWRQPEADQRRSIT
jgi:dTDP-4-dehydrorhamnose reductase